MWNTEDGLKTDGLQLVSSTHDLKFQTPNGKLNSQSSNKAHMYDLHTKITDSKSIKSPIIKRLKGKLL